MLEKALGRTMLLMRGDLVPQVTDEQLLAALTSVSVSVVADEAVCSTHSGQCAVVTTALTLARSGHQVRVVCPDAELVGPQPPLRGSSLASALAEISDDLLPGRGIAFGGSGIRDLAIVLGDGVPADAVRTIHFGADDWSAAFGPDPKAWRARDWPLGALAIAPAAAAEAYKLAMRSLAAHAASPAYFEQLFAPAEQASLDLAPSGTARPARLPDFDVVSGGAIANALFSVLHRIPGLRGRGRVLDHDVSALSNLNRNALLRRSAVGLHKVEDLARLAPNDGVALAPDSVRFVEGMDLARTVLVGVDDIPSRWAVQRSGPDWVGVGATDRYAALVSSHAPGEPCSGCLHPVAPPTSDAPIPTCAFVSLLSGLLLAVHWLRSLDPAGERQQQQTFVNALRPEGWAQGSMPLAAIPTCPVGCQASRRTCRMANAA